MKATELRIGNYVESNSSIYIIKSVSRTTLWIQHIKEINLKLHYNIKNIKPIPLTEEWLLKFGFKFDGTYYNKKLNKHHVFSIPVLINSDGTIYFMAFTDSLNIDILNVHQLQNLYFALTGKELEIK